MINGTKINYYNQKRIIKDLNNVITTGQVSNGKHCKESEQLMNQTYGFKESHCCGSGTEAIELGLRGTKKKWRSVLIPSLAPPMVKWAVQRSGYVPIIADVNKNTYMLDYETIKKHEVNTIILIHIGGWVCPDVEKISTFCMEKGINLIEDCSHSPEALINNKMVGTFGDVAAFSFYATKTLNCGEGGMVSFNTDSEINMKTFINQGRNRNAEYIYDSYNYRMTEFQGAVLSNVLKDSQKYISRRRAIAKKYDDLISKTRLANKIFKLPDQKSSYYKYIVKVKDDHAKEFFFNMGVNLPGKVWDEKELLNSKSNSNFISENHICLPMHTDLTMNDIKKTVEVLKEYDKERIQL